jgi:hypothetical protein
MGRLLPALLAALAAVASAGESDGGHAHPERWTHPDGPASASRRSLARAPLSFGGILWSYRAKRQVLAAPLAWDGAVFVLDGTPQAATLVALDAEDGKPLARAEVAAPGEPRPAVHDRSLFVLERGSDLVQYRLEGRKLARTWTFAAGAGASAPRIHEGEIYLTGPQGLVRLREGRSRAVWTAVGGFIGEPAVFGGHVYALRREGASLVLAALARADGREVASATVAPTAPAKGGDRVAVSEEIVVARIGPASRAIIARKETDGNPVLTLARTIEVLSEPVVGRAIVALAKPGGEAAWTVFQLEGRRQVFPFVREKQRPDLVAGAAPPVLLQETFCFGKWAADVNANLVFWHLDEKRGVRDFANGVRHAVPAGHERLLVVTHDGKALHLVGPEELEE